MSAPPYMKLYIGDYLGDTRHLTTLEHGAYLLLIMAMWRAGGALPAADTNLAKLCGCSTDQWAEIRDTILAFFKRSRGKISHKRVAAEIAKYENISGKRKEAGKQGGRKKHNDNSEQDEAIANQLPTYPEPEPEVIDTVVSRAADATPAKSPSLPGEFTEAWKACTPAMRKRSLSLAKTLPHWSLAARLAGSPGALLAALRRYLRDDPDVGRTGGPGFHLWLRDGTWEHYLTSPGVAATDATQAETTRRVRHWRDTGEWRPEWGQHPAKAAA